ncbi:MAG: OB-fold domain-containing protein [Alphaproteobacteria bacterium]|nr:OB-fold domain-containing protein [Alphaproteobacteria bacterium]
MIGITAYGAYIPRLRLARKSIVEANSWSAPELRSQGKGERAMCNWDEDTLTMAVEAARDCLGDRDRAGISAIHLASTTVPFADRQNAGIVAAALAMPEDISTMDVTSSQRAGTTGLIAALGLAAHGNGDVLFVASDSRQTRAGGIQELQYGDGAVALAVGRENVIARLLGSHSVTVDFVDHYRASDREFDYTWEERWIRDEGYARIVPQAVKGVLARTGLAAADFRYFILPCVLPKVAASLAKKIGFAEDAVVDPLHASCGETGTAHAILMFAHVLERAKPGERILVLGFGQGCDALAFEVTEAIAGLAPRAGVSGALARRKEETNYSKFLAFNGLVEKEKGKRAELDNQTALSTLYRNREMLLGLIGGLCTACGTRQFPKSLVCVNPNCRARRTQVDCRFADTPCSIMTFSADYLTYTADPPLHYGMVQFDGGGRFLANFTDVDVGAVKVGQPMRMMFRVKDFDDNRGFRRYFWKAAPAPAQGG